MIGPTGKLCSPNSLWEWAWVSMGQTDSAAASVSLVPDWMRGSSRRQEKLRWGLGAGCGPPVLGKGQLLIASITPPLMVQGVLREGGRRRT